MGDATPLDLFRRGLLDGHVLAVTDGTGAVAGAVATACEALGAVVERPASAPLDEAGAADFAAAVAERRGGLDTLVVDAGSAFAAAAPAAAGAAALRAAAAPAWNAARAAATAAMIDAEAGGKIVVVAPPPGAGPRAHATRAALENLARTLSIEWSRYAIRTTTILPGDATTPAELGAVVAFLASPAGDYYSGCVLDLTGPG
jgi:citronellol/citronellal dehydrogenase